jgi:peptidoglycan/xylan/chitin deacetylase (PgdA/CDA1 family)
MPSTSNSRRERERERRRKRVRRQREAAALVVLLGLAASAGLLLWGVGGLSRHSTAIGPPGETAPLRLAAEKAVPLQALPLATDLRKAIETSSSQDERAALAFFAARGQPLYCGGSSGRYVALTFDDGPGAYTATALRILERAHVKATFFLIGRVVAPRAGQARAELASSAALGIHTWSHPSLTALARPQIVAQIERGGSAIVAATKKKPALFRPPYGNRDATVDAVAKQLGLVEVLWSIDSGDSQGKNWREAGREVMDNIRPGSIVLMHENRGQALRALKYVILPGLKKRGFIPVTIPELLVLDPPPLHGPPLRCWQSWHPY